MREKKRKRNEIVKLIKRSKLRFVVGNNCFYILFWWNARCAKGHKNEWVEKSNQTRANEIRFFIYFSFFSLLFNKIWTNKNAENEEQQLFYSNAKRKLRVLIKRNSFIIITIIIVMNNFRSFFYSVFCVLEDLRYGRREQKLFLHETA